VAALGWDFGGDWALQTAMLLRDDLDAAVVYYGPVTDDEQELSLIDAPILALFGADDRTIRVESIQRFEASLQRLRKDHTVHIYPDASHGFASPGDNSYDEDIAEDAWQKTLEFLQLHLANADD
jgi:carboxymethylenebutenolidase